MTVGFAGYGQKRVEKSRIHELPLYPFQYHLSHLPGFLENLTAHR
jgi:hypothetical protein